MIKPYFSSKQARQSCNNLRTFCLHQIYQLAIWKSSDEGLKYIFAFPVFMSGRGNEQHLNMSGLSKENIHSDITLSKMVGCPMPILLKTNIFGIFPNLFVIQGFLSKTQDCCICSGSNH